MIKKISIENYKSIRSLKLNMGRLTVLIGDNGCGKTNILEAIAFSSAAANNKLDNDFLASRGIRVTEPAFMRNAFDPQNATKEIRISLEGNNKIAYTCVLQNENSLYSKWVNKQDIPFDIVEELPKRTGEKLAVPSREEYIKLFKEDFIKSIKEQIIKTVEDDPVIFPKEFLELSEEDSKKRDEIIEKIADRFFPEFFKEFLAYNATPHIHKFIIFSPEVSSLRTFEKEGQILPLGINGEGLFKLMKYFSLDPNITKLNEIKKYLDFVDWFDGFDIPQPLSDCDNFIRIKDRHLGEELSYFNPKSYNEGFLYLLFYTCLFSSDDTPKFFAIDSIDNSLNTEICGRLIGNLSILAEKYDKQAIITTRNPAILEQLEIEESGHLIYYVHRDERGSTQLKALSGNDIARQGYHKSVSDLTKG